MTNFILMHSTGGSPEETLYPWLKEKLGKVRINAAFIVAGVCPKLGLPQFEQLTASFIENLFNWERVRNNCGKFLTSRCLN